MLTQYFVIGLSGLIQDTRYKILATFNNDSAWKRFWEGKILIFIQGTIYNFFCGETQLQLVHIAVCSICIKNGSTKNNFFTYIAAFHNWTQIWSKSTFFKDVTWTFGVLVNFWQLCWLTYHNRHINTML